MRADHHKDVNIQTDPATAERGRERGKNKHFPVILPPLGWLALVVKPQYNSIPSVWVALGSSLCSHCIIIIFRKTKDKLFLASSASTVLLGSVSVFYFPGTG